MASKKITYNVPGIGNLTTNIFDYTQDIYGFLEYYGHIGRFRRINQLGRLREVFQGAHHNRYEYVFLQLSLISELCKNKQGNLGLSGSREFCGKLDNRDSFPSTGELLQCLVLLTNMGYLEGTFATSRAWITQLKEDQNSYNKFRAGLDRGDREYLTQVVETYDYYKFQIVIALFLLQRYKRKGHDKVNFCTELLRQYLNPDRSNIQILELRRLFDSIRQIAFITLDSIYAPVPFNLDLSSILLNFDSLLDSLFIKNTTYRIALLNLEQVLQNSVYLASDSCINTARASEETLEEIRDLATNFNGIMDVYNTLCPACNIESQRVEIKELDWFKERKLVQEFRVRRSRPSEYPKPLLNEVDYEVDTRQKIGVSRVRIGLLLNSRKDTIKLVFAITTENNIQSLKAALLSSVEAIKFRQLVPDNYFNRRRGDNELQILSFLCKSIFGWKKRFIFENKNRRNSAILVSNGRISMLEQIDAYLLNAEEYLKADELFEVQQVREFIVNLNYSGLTIAFVGGTKLIEEGQNNESAEFDGLVICPTINPSNDFAYIIEAKNYNNGRTDARNQLNQRVNPHLIHELKITLEDLNNRTSYAKIKSP